MKKLIRKYFIIFMCVFIMTNSVVVSEVNAEAVTLSLASVTAAAGGALSVLGPILLAVGVAYAGYKIYQNKDKLYAAFTSWYTASSSVVATWLATTAAAIDAGIITDGDTLSIPSDVLNESAEFVSDYAVSFGSTNVIESDSEIIYINTLSDYVTNSDLKEAIADGTYITYAPVIIIKDTSIGTESVWMCCQNESSIGGNTLLFYNGSYLSAQYCTYQAFLSGAVSGWTKNTTTYFRRYYTKLSSGVYSVGGDTQINCSYLYNYIVSESSYMNSSIPGTDLAVNGNTITGMSSDWNYAIKIVFPKNSCMAIYNSTDVNTDTGYINPSLCDIVHSPTGSELDNPLTKQAEYTYTPSYVIDDVGDEVLSIPIDNNFVTAIGDYVIDGLISEWDLASILDGEGVVEIDNTADILDVVKDLPNTIVTSLKNAFEWLFVPDSAKVNEFVTEATEIIDSNAGIFTYPIELVIRFLNELSELGNEDCILTIPVIGWNGYIFYKGSEFNFTDFVEQSEFSTIYNYYLVVTDFIMIIAVLDMAVKKGSEIIRGN